MKAKKLASGLGWFSIGLGLFELFGAERLGRMLGLPHRTRLLRLFGLREIATGIGIFASEERASWLWGRVAGDAIDLLVLATALRSDNPKRRNAAFAVGNVAAVTALDVMAARQLPV
jgi:hypothetical protein